MKGNVGVEVVTIFVFILIGSIAIPMGYVITDDLQTSLNQSEINATALEHTKEAIVVMDQGIVMLLAGLFVAGIISAYMLRQHPMFAIFSLLALCIVTPLIALMSNVYENYAVDPAVSGAMTNFTLIQQIWANAPAIAFIFGGVIIMVAFMFGVGRGGDGYS